MSAERILFIKLGKSGLWEKECIESGTLRFGFREAIHSDCVNGDWKAVTKHYIQVEGKKPGKATEITNQIKSFYEEPETTIWITFYGDSLWWCKARKEVKVIRDGYKERKVVGAWSNCDMKGNQLSLSTISGKLLQTRGFRGTICQPSALEYARRRILGEVLPEVTTAIEQRKRFVDSILPVIQGLSPQDFEILVDLIFRNGGWQRSGVVGGTEKSIDLDLYSPITREQIAIQIKSKSSQKEFDSYLETFKEMQGYDRFFYFVHTGGEELKAFDDQIKIDIVAGPSLADLTVRAGLVDWIIEKAS